MINYARDHTIKDGLDYIAVWQTGMFSGPHMGEAFKAKAEKRRRRLPRPDAAAETRCSR